MAYTTTSTVGSQFGFGLAGSGSMLPPFYADFLRSNLYGSL